MVDSGAVASMTFERAPYRLGFKPWRLDLCTIVTEEQIVEIDQESLMTLRSLVHSVQVSLTGLDQRIKRELEVIEVSQSLASRARDFLTDLLKKLEDGT
jgi:hypothetical protein